MKWLVRIVALYLVIFVFALAVVAVAGSTSPGPGTSSHEQMDPVSHSDYELHKSIGHIP